MIEDAIKLSLLSRDDFEKEMPADMLIEKISFVQANSKALIANLVFKDTSALSVDVEDPDILILRIEAPGLFIDVETGLRLEGDQLEQRVIIQK